MATRWILAALLGTALAAATADTGRADPAAGTPHPFWNKADKPPGTDTLAPQPDGKHDRTDFGSERSGSGNLYAQSLAAVLVILVLGAGAIFVVKRLLPRLGISQGRRINVLETVYLGSRKSLHLVQVGDRTLLLGDARERLGLLADLTGSVDPDDAPRAVPVRRKKPEFVIPVADPEGN
ncbi:MAG: hypothetical protein AMK72_06005 [Planctomycetes bacterium SM23_25]|nr:MAG: hypothetical protein AMS14_01610 [Planctomycetes bacterium DG_20]KPK48794.1 MAG: hypothetical protein AMK72_06005 [Planctomycetes bacterium SM23_25]